MRYLAAPAVLLLTVSAACRARTQPGPRVDPALATLTPQTAVALVGVRMDKIRETAIYKRQVAARNLPELDDFARQTGLDPRTDVWELLFVFDGSDWVALARGRFSPGFGGLEPRVLPGAPRRRYGGFTLIGDEQATTAFINSSTAVAGSGGAVRGILDRRSQSAGIPRALEERMAGIPPASQIWSAWTSPAGFAVSPEGNWANLARVANRVRAGWMAAQLRDGAELSAAAEAPTAVEAKLLSDALNALAGLARFTAPSDRPELGRFYESIRIGRQEGQVRVTASAPADVVDKLMPMIR
jgi:hypothetical protein